jgi:hypothetical protein
MPCIRTLLSVIAVCLAASSSSALNLEFEILLDGLQETPPVATPGSGTGSLFLDDTTGNYTISGTFQDLIGTTNNAHIHGPAAIGVGPAGVIHGLTFDFGVTSGTYSNGAGLTTFTAAQMADLINGLYYVNIHSTFRPGGEIRGQILLVPEPGTGALVALGILGLAVRRRSIAA